MIYTYSLVEARVLCKSCSGRVLGKSAHEDVESFEKTDASVGGTVEFTAVNKQRVHDGDDAGVRMGATSVDISITHHEFVVCCLSKAVAVGVVQISNAYGNIFD